MQLVDYGIVTVYIVSMVLVGLYFQRKAAGSIDSYFLGNRKMPWWALGASGMSSNLDISGTMINTAFIFALGASGFFIEIRGGVTLIMAFLLIFPLNSASTRHVTSFFFNRQGCYGTICFVVTGYNGKGFQMHVDDFSTN